MSKVLGELFDYIGMPLKYLVSTPITDGPHETPTYVEKGGVPFLSVDAIQNGELIVSDDRMISFEDAKRYGRKCQPIRGDILIGKAASTGKIAQVKTDEYFSIWSPLAMIRPNKLILNSYLEYYLKSILGQDQIDLFANVNTQKNVGMEDLGNVVVLVPDLIDQKKISNHLGKIINAVDSLIAKEENNIDRLIEIRRSFIIEKTNVGKSIKLKYLSKLVTGSTPESTNSRYWDGDISWITPADMVDGKGISVGERSITLDGLNSCSTKLIPPNSIVMSTRAPIGTVTITEKELCFNQGCKALVINKEINPRYVFYSLMANSDSLKNLGKGTTFMELSSNDFENYKIKVPRIETQNGVVAELDAKCAAIDSLIELKLSKIEKLKEYEKSLIYECVTGRRKV